MYVYLYSCQRVSLCLHPSARDCVQDNGVDCGVFLLEILRLLLLGKPLEFTQVTFRIHFAFHLFVLPASVSTERVLFAKPRAG